MTDEAQPAPAVADSPDPAESAPNEGGPGAGASKATKSAGPAPWAKDLEDLGIDDPKVDEYLRTKWQPRMTQFEQEAAGYRGHFGNMENATAAAQLLTALDENPTEALKWLAGELQVDPLDLIGDIEDAIEDDPETLASGEQPDLEAKLREMLEQDPRIKYSEDRMSADQQAEEDNALEELLSGMDAHYTGQNDLFNRDLFVHLLKASDGDADAAYEAYEQFHTPATQPDDPPPTGAGQKGVTPREAPQYGSIADAVRAFASDERTAAVA